MLHVFLLLVLGRERGSREGVGRRDSGLPLSIGDKAEADSVDGGGEAVGSDGGGVSASEEVDADLASAGEGGSVTTEVMLLGEHAAALLVRPCFCFSCVHECVSMSCLVSRVIESRR